MRRFRPQFHCICSRWGKSLDVTVKQRKKQPYLEKVTWIGARENTLQQGREPWVMGLHTTSQSPTHLPPCSSAFTCISSLVHIPRTVQCHCIRSLSWQQGQVKHPSPPDTSSHLGAQTFAWNPREPGWETVPPEKQPALFSCCASSLTQAAAKPHKHWVVVVESMEMLSLTRRDRPRLYYHQPLLHRLPSSLALAHDTEQLTTTKVPCYS